MLDFDGVVALPSTSAPATNTDDQFEDYSKIWCYCSQPSFGTMIMCNNGGCTIQWFQCNCLRIRNPPKEQWYCPACRKSPRFNNKKRANNNTAVIIEIILFSHSSHKIINHCHMTQKYYNLILGNNRWEEIN